MHHFMVVQLLTSQNIYHPCSYWISTYSQLGHTQFKSHHQSKIQNFYIHNWTLSMNEKNNGQLNQSCTIHDLFLPSLNFMNWSCIQSFYSSNKLPNESILSCCWFWLPMIVFIWVYLRKKHLTNKIDDNPMILYLW